MDNQGKFDNFVFYGSWREALEGLKNEFGIEYARETLWEMMLLGTAGDMETTKASIRGIVDGMCRDNIIAARKRYEKTKENGAKGGRPRKAEPLVVAELLQEGKTKQEIAEELNCSVRTVERAIADSGATKLSDKTTDRQNLDIEIESEKECESELECENEFEFYTEKATDSDSIKSVKFVGRG